jgi:hypothetical protein
MRGHKNREFRIRLEAHQLIDIKPGTTNAVELPAWPAKSAPCKSARTPTCRVLA